MSATTRAVRLTRCGGPEVLELADTVLDPPGAGEVRVRNTAIALNFYDIYERRGLYPIDLPVTPGSESAGVVEALGAGVQHLAVGDRVVVLSGPGNCAEAMNADASRVVRLPGDIDETVAAAMMTKAMTVEYLLERCVPVRRGQTVVFHAAAGGVGLIACQWARALGARVIGTVSSDAKARLARMNGCHVPVIWGQDTLEDVVRTETGGKGVPVVFDSIGRTSFETSLACLARRGTLVSFGQSSGEPEPFRMLLLAATGSIFMTRPTLDDYTATRLELEASARRVFDMVGTGKLKVTIGQTFDLADIAKAHELMESRHTTGSTVLVP
ncbi:MAG: quinone oxidoreductase [bacterium]|nr:quinone oxidoreductase [bacterium]